MTGQEREGGCGVDCDKRRQRIITIEAIRERESVPTIMAVPGYIIHALKIPSHFIHIISCDIVSWVSITKLSELRC